MLLGLIRVGFCLLITAAMAIESGYVAASGSVCAGILIGSIVLFSAGCRVAAGRAAERAAAQAEKKGARDALIRVKARALADLTAGDLAPSEAHQPRQ